MLWYTGCRLPQLLVRRAGGLSKGSSGTGLALYTVKVVTRSRFHARNIRAELALPCNTSYN